MPYVILGCSAYLTDVPPNNQQYAKRLFETPRTPIIELEG